LVLPPSKKALAKERKAGGSLRPSCEKEGKGLAPNCQEEFKKGRGDRNRSSASDGEERHPNHSLQRPGKEATERGLLAEHRRKKRSLAVGKGKKRKKGGSGRHVAGLRETGEEKEFRTSPPARKKEGTDFSFQGKRNLVLLSAFELVAKKKTKKKRRKGHSDLHAHSQSHGPIALFEKNW